MKKLFILAGTCAVLTMTTPVMAIQAKTSLNANWICTTNASSSSLPADNAADDEMAKVAKSAAEAFGFAANNCRDCTNITCETK